MLPEPIELLKQAITISSARPEPVAMVGSFFTREKAEGYLRDGIR